MFSARMRHGVGWEGWRGCDDAGRYSIRAYMLLTPLDNRSATSVMSTTGSPGRRSMGVVHSMDREDAGPAAVIGPKCDDSGVYAAPLRNIFQQTPDHHRSEAMAVCSLDPKRVRSSRGYAAGVRTGSVSRPTSETNLTRARMDKCGRDHATIAGHKPGRVSQSGEYHLVPRVGDQTSAYQYCEAWGYIFAHRTSATTHGRTVDSGTNKTVALTDTRK